ncbi:MAG: LysR family transcriptional regulator [Myxococcales bacterium]|nr:LysR family transcriptional regulator [Myxococcales bacterium]
MIDALRHFLLIVEHGTFTAAARHAHVSQPALTSSIHRLEAQLDARLLDRGRQGATLTEAGRVLLPHARAAVVAIEDGRRAMEALGRLDTGLVRIGGGQTACTYLLPPVLSAFRRKFPGVALRLREMPEELAVDAFEAGELDLVVAGGARGDRFRDEQIVLVAAPGLDPKSLPFIAFVPGSAVRAVMDRHFAGVPIAMELGSISTVKGSVRAGLGIALVSRTAVATDLSLGRLVEVRDPRTPLPRPLRLVHRGVERLSPAAAALRRLLLADAPKPARRAR